MDPNRAKRVIHDSHVEGQGSEKRQLIPSRSTYKYVKSLAATKLLTPADKQFEVASGLTTPIPRILICDDKDELKRIFGELSNLMFGDTDRDNYGMIESIMKEIEILKEQRDHLDLSLKKKLKCISDIKMAQENARTAASYFNDVNKFSFALRFH